MTVSHNEWDMVYHYDGTYTIFRDGAEFATDGRYDSVITASYNEMPEEKRVENLRRDLVSWVEKAIKGKVVD